MNINIRGDKLKVTPAIKEHIDTKLSRVEKYFEGQEDINANVVIRVRGIEQIIEITIPTKNFLLRAEESNNDLYAAADLVIDKLENQIRKNKTKISKRYKGIIIPEIDDKEKYEELGKIVKRKNIDTKPMDEEEALLQMELLNHDFFVFKNIDEECVSVLYYRKDKNIGIINVK